jgi:hypothetical protein
MAGESGVLKLWAMLASPMLARPGAIVHGLFHRLGHSRRGQAQYAGGCSDFPQDIFQ